MSRSSLTRRSGSISTSVTRPFSSTANGAYDRSVRLDDDFETGAAQAGRARTRFGLLFECLVASWRRRHGQRITRLEEWHVRFVARPTRPDFDPRESTSAQRQAENSPSTSINAASSIAGSNVLISLKANVVSKPLPSAWRIGVELTTLNSEILCDAARGLRRGRVNRRG